MSEFIKRNSYETIIVVVVVALSLVLGASLYAARTKVQKGFMLTRELNSIRTAVVLYKMVNKKNPDTLADLAIATYTVDSTKRPFADNMPEVKDGKVIDPFGSTYKYDNSSGWVSSTSIGYEKW